jgi:hypothetical protein
MYNFSIPEDKMHSEVNKVIQNRQKPALMYEYTSIMGTIISKDELLEQLKGRVT